MRPEHWPKPPEGVVGGEECQEGKEEEVEQQEEEEEGIKKE